MSRALDAYAGPGALPHWAIVEARTVLRSVKRAYRWPWVASVEQRLWRNIVRAMAAEIAAGRKTIHPLQEHATT